MSCCGPSRRPLLGAIASAALLSAVPASRARAQAVSVVATDLEVVTVTDRSVVLTWTTVAADGTGRLVPVPSDAEVRLGAADSTRAPVPVFADPERTPFHYAEIGGLEPGRRYRFEAWSQGARATPALSLTTLAHGTPETTGEFTTLVPPTGRLLRTIALANDVHYGETVSGLVVGGFPPGFRQLTGQPPYPEVMLDALLDDLRAREVDRLVVAGDLTSEATPDESRAVRARLDTWGTLGGDYLVTRGNHDRPHVGYQGCTHLGGHRDCWGDNFLPRQQLVEHEVGGLRLLGVDTSELDGSGGRIERPQFDRLAEVLRADPDRPTLVFGHHPVTRESGLTNTAGPGFVLDGPDSAELQRYYERAPGVFLHHSGHTHRNRRTRPDANIAVEFLEVAAVKEYPGGYSLLRVYEGGYMVNFYKTRAEGARRWSSTTRGEYFGLLPDYTFGTFADRNHVVARDFSGLS
ncbi:metallophosphoesterase [Nocardia amikacinitolerans]|uniref:metallophosphoesterase n=1 Tax=Nocardia amikacinitolerans TaxID=756689 RepID=UPI0020A43DF0|nr:metallophosphoesterase [Nocardia amikacinitolerans]MCP2289039.1 3',5'-cyclic AMP phosphodiesterase CpdA [Nocardia amikacinitolerans]